MIFQSLKVEISQIFAKKVIIDNRGVNSFLKLGASSNAASCRCLAAPSILTKSGVAIDPPAPLLLTPLLWTQGSWIEGYFYVKVVTMSTFSVNMNNIKMMLHIFHFWVFDEKFHGKHCHIVKLQWTSLEKIHYILTFFVKFSHFIPSCNYNQRMYLLAKVAKGKISLST